MHKKRRKKKNITFHIKSRFVDNFISENKVHVCKHFIYLFILFYFIHHIFMLVKGGFIFKLFEDRWGVFFRYIKTFWNLTTFTVQRAILDNFCDKHFRVYIFVFWSASKKYYKFEINVKNVFLKYFLICFCCVNYFFMIV
jgi:hypothetical protein